MPLKENKYTFHTSSNFTNKIKFTYTTSKIAAPVNDADLLRVAMSDISRLETRLKIVEEKLGLAIQKDPYYDPDLYDF